MTRFADPHRCPDCRALLAPGSQHCGHCGLDLTGELGHRLFVTLSTADTLLVQLLRARSDRAEAAVPAGAPADVAVPVEAERLEPAVPASVGANPAGPFRMGQGPAGSAGGTPTPPPDGVGGVRPSSVPKILLSLGATCLLVAALVFLAVTWSVMGVGGRTATLVGFTVATGALCAVSARHGLRGAVEALGLVTIGLAVLDVVGARSAGWLGEPTDAGFMTALGALLLGGGLAAAAALVRSPAKGFTGGELAAAVGSLMLFWGLNSGAWADAEVRALVTTLVLAAVTAGVWSRVTGGAAFRVAAIGTTTIAAGSWLAQSAMAVAHAADEPTISALWGRLQVWPLLAAISLGVAVAAVRRIPTQARVVTLGVSVVLAGLAATLPSYDESATVTSLTLVVAVLVVAAGVALAPRPWGVAGLGALSLGSVALLVPVLGLAAGAVQVYGDTAALAWSGTPGSSVVPASIGEDLGAPWLLPVCVGAIIAALLAALRLADELHTVAVRHVAAVAGGILTLSGAAAVLHYPVPVWTVLVGLLGVATAAVSVALRRGSRSLMALGAFLVAVSIPLSFADEHLTTITLLVTLVLTGAAHFFSRDETVAEVAGGALPFVLAGLAWSTGAAYDLQASGSALAGLLLLGMLAIGRGFLERDGQASPAVAVVELCAGLAAMPLAVAGIASAPVSETSSWTAVYLTIAGAFATLLALLRPDRRHVAWLGGLLLAAATWVRLYDLGVHEPEPYTLPTALVLLGVGLVHLRRHPGASTQTALGAGLALALVPSLLWVLVDPTGVRAVLLGLACLGLVLAGLQARWSAPLVHGSVVGLLVVLREAGPFIGDSVPRWALIGAAGVLLIGLGVTWEARMRDAKRAVDYVRALR